MIPVVITPERDHPCEHAVLETLFAEGLERCHVRKPHATAGELAAWIARISPRWRSRLILHQHHELVEKYGLGGIHWRDLEGAAGTEAAGRGLRSARFPDAPPAMFRSRSCHDLATLRASLGVFDSVFFSPVFSSISKPGYAPALNHAALADFLHGRMGDEHSTRVLALGGIDAQTAPRALAMGFDGLAVLGAVWQANDPIAAYREIRCSVEGERADALPSSARSRSPLRDPILCITQDNLPLTHLEQAERLCAAGAKSIQLRMKAASRAEWLAEAEAVVAVCRRHGAICVINDSVDIALESGADGVHLGRTDGDWKAARARVGPGRILGGTVNNASDAAAALDARCLDYVGVGPWRFTANKKNLAPVLGREGIQRIVTQLSGLPVWAIGGIEADDLAEIRTTGAAGAAVSSVLFRGGSVEENYRRLVDHWHAALQRTASHTFSK